MAMISREPDFPPEAAQLVNAFGACAKDHKVGHVLEAAANFLILALIAHGRANEHPMEGVVETATKVTSSVLANVRAQWDRKPQPTDVPVETQ